MNTIDLVRKLLKEILLERNDVTLIFSRQRAKFEGWLKLELASALEKQQGIEDLALEENYSGKRADIAFTHGENRWLIEMKTPNTSWRVDGVEIRNRPITKNITSIIKDIQKLELIEKPVKKAIVFTLFPIPVSNWYKDTNDLNYHLGRIEEYLGASDGILLKIGELVNVTSEYGIGVFVFEVEPDRSNGLDSEDENKTSEFENIWKFLQHKLRPGTVVKNWTAYHGYLGDNMTIHDIRDSYIVVKAPKAQNLQNVPKKDMEKIWGVWKDYKIKKVRRPELRDMTRFSKFIISIFRWYEEEVKNVRT